MHAANASRSLSSVTSSEQHAAERTMLHTMYVVSKTHHNKSVLVRVVVRRLVEKQPPGAESGAPGWRTAFLFFVGAHKYHPNLNPTMWSARTLIKSSFCSAVRARSFHHRYPLPPEPIELTLKDVEKRVASVELAVRTLDVQLHTLNAQLHEVLRNMHLKLTQDSQKN